MSWAGGWGLGWGEACPAGRALKASLQGKVSQWEALGGLRTSVPSAFTGWSRGLRS